MAIRTTIIASSLVGALFAVGCVISSDTKGGVFNHDSGVSGNPNVDSGSTAGHTNTGGHSNGNVDAGSTGGSGGTGGGEVDAGSDSGGPLMCFAPNGDECSDCVADNCLAEYCACEADAACGSDAGELSCMIQCVADESTMGTTADDAYSNCAAVCAVDAFLADATNDTILCMRQPVPDPLFADAGVSDGGIPDIALCGESCFGYYEPAAP